MLDSSYRTRLPVIISNLANEYNIDQVKVKEIITDYNTYNRELLLQGYEIEYVGICKVVPTPCKDIIDETLAYKCNKIAKEKGYPPKTLYYIIKAYLDYLKTSILEGKIAEIRGICTIHPCIDCIHSNISLSLSKTIEELDTIEKARVHTSKALKLEARNYDRENS